MKKLNVLFSALIVLGSQAHATSPIMPYVPSEAFKYSCEVTLVSYSYRTGENAKQYTSKARVEIDNNQQFLTGENLKWVHRFAVSNPNLPYMPEGRIVAQAPNVKESSLYLNFDYPQDGVTNLTLSAMLYTKQGDKSVHIRGEAFGTFDDKRVGTQAETMQYSDGTGTSTSKKLTVRCEKI
jgi:hypothetical protein